jgi:hypothetical protein
LTTPNRPLCPHCEHALQAFELPDNTGWQSEFHLACFNDECPYFVRGWDHMESNFAVKASYRYRVDPATGNASPLPVWSSDALKDRIIEAAIGDETESGLDEDDSENGGRP